MPLKSMWCYDHPYIDVIEVANGMTTKHEINRLLQTLYELYSRLCARDLRKRMSSYHRNTSNNGAPDVSISLINNIEKLAPASKPSSAATDRSSNKPAKPSTATQPSRQPKWLNKVVSSFNRPKKIFTSKIAPNQYMGEKLKDSTWSHIHTALLHARQGDVSNAKLHADIANGALQEAAHYMTEEDYNVFCAEVAKAFKELEG